MLPERRLPCGTPWQSCSFGIAEETRGGAGAEVGGGGIEGGGGGGGRRMAGILYANIRRRLTITLARGETLNKKKNKVVTQTKQKSQVRVRLLVSEIFYGFAEWNQQLGGYFSAKAGK